VSAISSIVTTPVRVSIVVVVGGSVVVVVGGAVATGGGAVAGTVVDAIVVVVVVVVLLVVVVVVVVLLVVVVVVGMVVDGSTAAATATGACVVVGGVVVVGGTVDDVEAIVDATVLPVAVCSEPDSNKTPAMSAIAAADTRLMIAVGVNATVRTAGLVRDGSRSRDVAAVVVSGCRRDLTRRVRTMPSDPDRSPSDAGVEAVSDRSEPCGVVFVAGVAA